MNEIYVPTPHYLDIKREYYKDGIEHVPLLDSQGWVYDHNNPRLDEAIVEFTYNRLVNKPYKTPCSYCPVPIETVSGFVYACERIPIGEKKELWKLSIKIVWRGWKTFKKKPNN